MDTIYTNDVSGNMLFNNSESSNTHKAPFAIAIAIITAVTFSSTNINSNIIEKPILFTDKKLNNNKTQTYSDYNQDEYVKINMKDGKINSLTIFETWNFNNNKLEVDDLADKVTQTQLDEVKAHFDTKISSLEKNLITQFTLMLNESSGDLKKHFSNELKENNSKKVDKMRFLIGSIVIPIGAVIGTLLFTKLFKIY